MRILIISDELKKTELAEHVVPGDHSITWVGSIQEAGMHPSPDVVIDLLFEEEDGHAEFLQQGNFNTVVINSVTATLSEIDNSFLRINGWPGFLTGSFIEGSAAMNKRKEAEEVFAIFGKTIEWLPDTPGFITPRVISMIINEAYLSLEEGVANKEAIDTAMKLGTNYPYGPFEWANLIGIDKISALLGRLSEEKKSFVPARAFL
jgi:3-hydroxybutyryl-CoA dehydrogenase